MGDNTVERKEDEPSGMDQLDAYIAAYLYTQYYYWYSRMANRIIKGVTNARY